MANENTKGISVRAKSILSTSFLFFVSATAFVAPSASSQSNSSSPERNPTKVSLEVLDDLGFSSAGTPIDQDGYVQLLVAVVVPKEGSTMQLNKCPKKGSLWNIDLKGLVKGDTTAALGLTISGPIIPPSTYAPIVMTVKSKGLLWGSTCLVEIDPIRYRSPLFGVRRYHQQNLKVEPVFASSRKLSDQIRADVSKLIGGLALVSGVSAVSAAPYLSTLDGGLQSLGFDNKERTADYFSIRPGLVSPPVIWEVPDALTSAKGEDPPRSAFVVAQLIPVKSAIPKPAHLSVWRHGAVLNAPYRTSSNTTPGSDTLSGYLYSVAGKEIDEYNSSTPQSADQACKALANKVDTVGLSESDAALVMWALARGRIDKGFSTEQDVDNLSCMRERWDLLKLAGIEKSSATKPVSAPSKDQMKAMSYIDDDLAIFFVTESWDVRKELAARLFAYPTSYTDANKRMMIESTTLESREGWVANAYSRDRPILAKFGCYAYFEGAEAHPFSQLAGRSVMVGFGELPPLPDGRRQEVMLQLNFAPTASGERARLNGVVLHEQVPEDVRLAAIAPYARLNKCTSGYRPKLLFGD